MGENLNFLLANNRNINVPVCLYFNDTKDYLSSFLDENAVNEHEKIRVSDTLIESWQKTTGIFDCFAEYNLLHIEASIYLMKYDCCLFHSVAVWINGKAWLLAGSSGIGKSTQYKNMLQIAPALIQIINGDKPLLEITDDIIFVHPSPWNGKEGWHSDISAPLEGIVFLKQETQNIIQRLDKPHSIIPVFRSICQDYRNDAVLEDTARLSEKIIMSIPIWEFSNDGSLNSSEILLQHIMAKGGI